MKHHVELYARPVQILTLDTEEYYHAGIQYRYDISWGFILVFLHFIKCMDYMNASVDLIGLYVLKDNPCFVARVIC